LSILTFLFRKKREPVVGQHNIEPRFVEREHLQNGPVSLEYKQVKQFACSHMKIFTADPPENLT